MYSEYAEILKINTAKFGQRTTVFLQVGSFYELYDSQDTETGETSFNVKDICDYLGLQISIRKGEAPNGKDGLVAGFPDYALHKWAGKLTEAGWTVIIVDQKKDSRGKVIERQVSRILSPSTHIENMTAADTPYLATLYFNNTSYNSPPLFGIASLDLTTGRTTTYGGASVGRPDFWTADALNQHMSIFQAKEVVLYWHSLTPPPAPASLRTTLGIAKDIPIHTRHIETIGTFQNELANSEYLRKVYSIQGLLPPSTFLGLRSQQETTALLFLLQFVEEHMPSAISNFSRNEPWVPHRQLICGNHALTQLQITGSNTDTTVASLFTGTYTPMGRRNLLQRLLRPSTDSTQIRARLDEVHEYTEWPLARRSSLQKNLRFSFDLPRLHRKIITAAIQQHEFAPLYQTYQAITLIAQELIAHDSLLQPTFSVEHWNAYRAIFDKNIDSSKVFTCISSQDITPFSCDHYPNILEIENNIQSTLSLFDKERRYIAERVGLAADALRLEQREKEPYGIKGSKSQLTAIQAKCDLLPKGTHLSILKSGGWVDTPELTRLNSRLMKLREELLICARDTLMTLCEELSCAGNDIWAPIEEWISHVDATQAIATTCELKGFTKPDIVESTDERGSFIAIEGLRHPLVEASATRITYVQHDITIGTSASENGYLIYGMNASGKSTLMKAVGIASLLAQAGCYVPARKMTLAPFRAVYTRILNQDNLFAGLSSFAVEMSELRDILSDADNRTLVLGDELCSGTESVSAEALVSAGIQWLSKKSAKFMFATHLHNIPKIIDPSAIGLKVCHLHVDYDPVTKKLIYDRSLRPGAGSSLYGLEVARAMNLPLDFIELALSNRHNILNTTVQSSAAASSWNTQIIRRSCEICSENIVSELEVHHIEPRSIASSSGILPNGMHMNSVSNLIVLCEKCHDEHHAGKIEIGNLVQTSNGPERIITQTPQPQQQQAIQKSTTKTGEEKEKGKGRGQWSDEEMENIHNTLKKFQKVALKTIQYYLRDNYDINISVSSLGSIRRSLLL